jgi:ABC-type oligopeptide transport system ATPase subunit
MLPELETGRIHLVGLSKVYPTGTVALRDVDLDVGLGEIVVLLGPSGAGKSTLLRCVNGLVHPTTGEARVDGLVVGRDETALCQVHQRAAMIFQQFNLVGRLPAGRLRAGDGLPPAGRARRPGRPAGRHALGRRAPAGRRRPGARPGPPDPPCGRAGGEPRSPVDASRTEPDVGVVYCHTTDYPMHMAPPEGELSLRHLAELDRRLGILLDTCPDLAVYLTADHGMNGKRRCYDLARALGERGRSILFAMSAERDPYVRHHRTFGGTAYVWLEAPGDRPGVEAALGALEGVEKVLSRHEAAACFHLHPDRIGDLVVLGDRGTVFGPLERPVEDLPAGFRTHGSCHELRVPLVVYGVPVPSSDRAAHTHNVHLTRSLGLDG